MRTQFRLMEFDEGGVQETPKSLRLVCCFAPNGKVAIWGSKRNHVNIDAVKNRGLPCTIECDCIEPQDWAKDMGHDFWVPEGNSLRVMAD